jgi:hypothetical protein
VVAHPSLNNKVVGSNPRSSIFLRGQAGAPQLHFFVAKSGLPRCGWARLGWAWVRPAGARCVRLGLGVAGWGWPGRGRGQPLLSGTWPIVARVWPRAGAVNRYHHLLFFTFFSIFHCIYNMVMCYFLIFIGFFHF